MQHTARRSFGDNGVPANGNETTTRSTEETTMTMPAKLSNLSASLYYGAKHAAAQAVNQTADRESALVSIAAATVDPDLLNALATLAASGMTASEVRTITALYVNGGMNPSVSDEDVPTEAVWEYGVTYVDPARPVSFSTSMDKAVESKAFYDDLIARNPSVYREYAPSNILRRTPGVAPGPWLRVDPEPTA